MACRIRPRGCANRYRSSWSAGVHTERGVRPVGLLVMAPWLAQTVEPWLQKNFGWIPIFNAPPMSWHTGGVTHPVDYALL